MTEEERLAHQLQRLINYIHSYHIRKKSESSNELLRFQPDAAIVNIFFHVF